VVTEFNLSGKTAVVTAAGRGIAKGVALVLAEAGADVALVALTSTHIEAVAAQVRAAGRRALAVATDVTDPAAVDRMAAAVLAEFGTIDILVNGAGDSISKPVATLPAGADTPARPGMTPEEWRAILDINLTEAFLCCRAFGPHFMERRAGKVINIGSFASRRPRPMGTAYAAGKAGVANFTAALALEWAPYGIQVNCIAPGQFPDPDQMSAEQYAAGLERARTAVPAGRPGYLRDVGLLAVYLASSASDFMTGQTLHLDGGATL
jgi:2-deoxy-D-gluconate 3-dehydrogenase